MTWRANSSSERALFSRLRPGGPRPEQQVVERDALAQLPQPLGDHRGGADHVDVAWELVRVVERRAELGEVAGLGDQSR